MIKGTELTLSKVKDIVRNGSEFVASEGKASQSFPTITLWMDLLGFRKHLDEQNWDIKSEEVQLGLKRIAVFHEAALLSMNERYEIVHMNDAIVISQDIVEGEEQKIVTEFLALVDMCFEVAALADKTVGGYGIRGVVTRGRRYGLRGNLGWTKAASSKPYEPSFFCPRPIMMNTALGRAYGVESSKKLAKESSLYIEAVLITDYGASIMETWDLNEPVEVDNFGAFFLVRSESKSE